MIRNLIPVLLRRNNCFPLEGQWYSTPQGHILRVSLVSPENQKVVCELPGRSYSICIPLIAFYTGRYYRRMRRSV